MPSFGFPTLRFGSIGPNVTLLQTVLNVLESAFEKLSDDGIFGAKTNARVKEFQGDAGTSTDGVVGPMTWEALQDMAKEAGFILTPGNIIPADGSMPKWAVGMDPAEVMLRISILTIAMQEADAGYGLRRALMKIRNYQAVSAVDAPQLIRKKNSFDIDEVASRDNLASRSWCSDYVFYCLRSGGHPFLPGMAFAGDSIGRFDRRYKSTTTPKPGDLYYMPFTSAENKAKDNATHHIGIFNHWGQNIDDPPGSTFRSLDGNSIDSGQADGSRVWFLGGDINNGTRVGSYYNARNRRDLGFVNHFISIADLK